MTDSPFRRVLLAGPFVMILAGFVIPVPRAEAFDPAAYRDFLAAHRDMTADRILAAHAPYGPYAAEVEPPAVVPAYLPELSTIFDLTAGEKSLLDAHGFMVTERKTFLNYGGAYRLLWQKDMPVFVSADAILHAVHRSYDNLLSAAETSYLAPELASALDELHAAWPDLRDRYAGTPELNASIADLDVYLATARSLLAGSTVPSMGGNDATVGTLLGYVAALQPVSYPLFNASPRWIDFSQFEPRGHYTDSVALRRYFQAMMWLGRTEMRLTPPPGEPATPDVSREIEDAFLLRELLAGTGAGERLARIDAVIRSLVGDSDNVTPPELDRLATAIGLAGPADLLDPDVMSAFETEIATGGYTAQGILSQIIMSDPMHPDTLKPPYAFLLLGQRFVIDSHILGQVVYDRIEYQGSRPFRELPSPLDALYALGNDDVLPLLADELATYHYASNLEALRYLVDSYDDAFWQGSLYNSWLEAIRTLAGSGRQEGAPAFMKTGAWVQEKMQSQLASWAELRHDNLLYAKQSYTGGITCSYPCGYVEPIPALYRSLGGFADRALDAFTAIPFPEGTQTRLDGFFARTGAIMDTLEAISEKELAAADLSDAESRFLGSILYSRFSGCGSVEDGWYRDLFFEFGDNPASTADLLIADVHTAPTDAAGNMVGHVLHVATGYPRLAVVLATPPGGNLTAFAGPVAAYHEHVTVNFDRLTDEEWQDLYKAGTPEPPDWTHVFLAGRTGVPLTGGRRLVDEPDRLVRGNLPARSHDPAYDLSVRVEGGGALLSFGLPRAGRVRLDIFDVGGRRVRRLLEDDLGTGTFHVRWDGSDDSGTRVGAGVYLARLRGDDASASAKLVLTSP